MKITIESVLNGYIISWEELDSEGKPEICKVLFAEATEGADMNLTKLLYSVAEHAGYTYDKFKEDNLNITFDKKGHKL